MQLFPNAKARRQYLTQPTLASCTICVTPTTKYPRARVVTIELYDMGVYGPNDIRPRFRADGKVWVAPHMLDLPASKERALDLAATMFAAGWATSRDGGGSVLPEHVI